jgi:hypothetical protein
MEVKILEVIDFNQVTVEYNGFIFSAKWLGHSVELGDTFPVEIEINEKFILNKNMYFYREEISFLVLKEGKVVFPVKILKVFDDNILSVKIENNKDAFLLEVENTEGLSSGLTLYLVTNAIELWPV